MADLNSNQSPQSRRLVLRSQHNELKRMRSAAPGEEKPFIPWYSLAPEVERQSVLLGLNDRLVVVGKPIYLTFDWYTAYPPASPILRHQASEVEQQRHEHPLSAPVFAVVDSEFAEPRGLKLVVQNIPASWARAISEMGAAAAGEEFGLLNTRSLVKAHIGQEDYLVFKEIEGSTGHSLITFASPRMWVSSRDNEILSNQVSDYVAQTFEVPNTYLSSMFAVSTRQQTKRESFAFHFMTRIEKQFKNESEIKQPEHGKLLLVGMNEIGGLESLAGFLVASKDRLMAGVKASVYAYGLSYYGEQFVARLDELLGVKVGLGAD